MSELPFALVPAEIIMDERLTLRQMKVLIALLTFRNRDTGLICPSRESISSRTGFPLSRISTITTELVSLGWLKKQGCGGRSMSCEYVFTTPSFITENAVKSITKTVTVTKTETVTNLEETVTDLVTKTVTDLVTKTVTDSVTGNITDNVTDKLTDKVTEKTTQKDFAIEEIFEHWREVMDHPKAQLDKKRRAVICNALAWGYSLDVLKQAISGCAKTPHNMGFNDRNQRYDGLELILRSADQIDRFVRNFHHPPALRNKQQQLEAGNTRVLSDWIPPELRHASQ